MWHVTCDTWHVTRDMWQVTRDMFGGVNHGFPWGTKIGISPISDLCTEIVLFWWDFYLQGQHWDFGLALSLGISQKALSVKEIIGFEDGLS